MNQQGSDGRSLRIDDSDFINIITKQIERLTQVFRFHFVISFLGDLDGQVSSFKPIKFMFSK